MRIQQPENIQCLLNTTCPRCRWTLASHAVEIVLASCPHHPTLLRILLDLCFSHRLAHNAQALLQALLFCAVRPTPVIPPLCHPLHSSFLLDIQGEWTCAGFSKYQFTSTLLTALGTVTSADAWASKAVAVFGKAACKTHLHSFLDLATALVDFISRQVRVCDQQKEDMLKVEGLLRSLCGWVNVLSEGYFSLDRINVALEDCHSLSEFISVICSLLTPTQALGISTLNLSTSVVKISTQWLVFFPMAAHTGRVVQSLRRLVPETTAYSHLIHSVYSSGNLRDCHKMVHTYASALRSSGLLHLEASLWACALRHLERPGPDDTVISNIIPARLEDYRQRLIHIVDEAESRCFGGPNPSLAMGFQPLPLNPIQPEEEGKSESLTPVMLNCHWEWESAIGCWMRKYDSRSPPKKRRRMAVNVSCTVKEARSSVNPKRLVPPPPGVLALTATQSPSHNFSSLLADAFTKRARLHQKPTRRDLIRTSAVVLNDKCRPPSCSTLSKQDHLPSDDALDLFTYPQSSPSRQLT